jgi:hypothetical protein
MVDMEILAGRTMDVASASSEYLRKILSRLSAVISPGVLASEHPAKADGETTRVQIVE